MKSEVIDVLLGVNERFYREQAQQFSDTRTSAWKGWQRCAAFVEHAVCDGFSEGDARRDGASRSCRVLDVACGNMRFEAFLRQELPAVSFDFVGVDNCEALSTEFVHGSVGAGDACIAFRKVDIVSALRLDDACSRSEALSFSSSNDMAVAFGFMHHVPTMLLRQRLLAELLACVRPGGCVAVSFWEFMRSPAMAEKAMVVHERAMRDLGLSQCDLEKNDFVIGWSNKLGAYRYCHSFSSEEIDELFAPFTDRVRVVDRFFADGRTNDLNEYVVLQVL